MFGIRPFYRKQEDDEQPDVPMFSSLMDDYNQGEDELQTPVFDRFMELAQNRPRREDYQPSTGRKVLAGIAGGLTGLTSGAAQGAKTVQDITEGPYRRAVEDYQTELEPIKQGVGFEKAFNETARKRLNDRQGYGVKIAKLEGEYTKAKDQLKVALQRAATEKERNQIRQAEADVDRMYKEQKIKIERMNAGSAQMRANASMIGAGARMMNAQKYSEQGNQPRPRHVPISEQLKAEAVGAKEALDDVLSQTGPIGVTLDNQGKLKFPKGMTEDQQRKFTEIFNESKSKKAKGRLDQVY